jgi:hypothetical protein
MAIDSLNFMAESKNNSISPVRRVQDGSEDGKGRLGRVRTLWGLCCRSEHPDFQTRHRHLLFEHLGSYLYVRDNTAPAVLPHQPVTPVR